MCVWVGLRLVPRGGCFKRRPEKVRKWDKREEASRETRETRKKRVTLCCAVCNCNDLSIPRESTHFPAGVTHAHSFLVSTRLTLRWTPLCPVLPLYLTQHLHLHRVHLFTWIILIDCSQYAPSSGVECYRRKLTHSSVPASFTFIRLRNHHFHQQQQPTTTSLKVSVFHESVLTSYSSVSRLTERYRKKSNCCKHRAMVDDCTHHSEKTFASPLHLQPYSQLHLWLALNTHLSLKCV